ncbi:MAG: hypothetical protein ACLTDO_09020 [Bifidobacterium pseudocatenulatum]
MVWWKHNRQACQSGQAEGPMPTPLPCPLCNGHAEAVMDSWTSGGYGYDFERWGCRCGECGYGYYGGNPLSPSDERQAIERWDQQVEEALKIIAEPLEECPSCHCVPKVGKSDGEAFLQCPECLKIARGGNHRDQDKWTAYLCGSDGLKAKRQAIVGTNHRKDAEHGWNSIIWVARSSAWSAPSSTPAFGE